MYVHEDPDELGYTLVPDPPLGLLEALSEEARLRVKLMHPDQLLIACNKLMEEHERADLAQAALLCHAGHHHNADRHRQAAGYGGCHD